MTLLRKSRLNVNQRQKMLVVTTKKRIANVLRDLLDKIEENNKPTQTGRIKAVSIWDEKTKTFRYRKGEVVFTRRGVGIVEDVIWSKGERGRQLVQVRHRKTGNKRNTRVNYHPKDVMKLIVVDENGEELRVSPMFYDHLILSIGKDIQFYRNIRNTAMLTKKQQEKLERARIASLKGAYNYVKALEDKGLLW